MWRYRELLPLLPGEEPVTLGEGFTPLLHARRLGAPIGLDRLFIKDESLNPTNSFKARGSVGGGHARQGAGRHRPSRCRPPATPAMPRPPMPPPPGCACQVFIPQGRQAAVHRRVPPVWRHGHAGRRPDHRCRQGGRGTGQAARLVRRLHAEGAVPHRRQEDDGLRAGRAARLAPARLDRLPHRRRHRPDRHVEGLRRDGSHRLDRPGSPAAHGVGAGRRLRADRPRVRDRAARRPTLVGERPHQRATACACRARSATS